MDKTDKWLEYAHTKVEEEYYAALAERKLEEASRKYLDLLEILEVRNLTEEEKRNCLQAYQLAEKLEKLEEILVIGKSIFTLQKKAGGWLLLDANDEGIRYYNDNEFVKRLLLKSGLDKLKETGTKAVLVKEVS